MSDPFEIKDNQAAVEEVIANTIDANSPQTPKLATAVLEFLRARGWRPPADLDALRIERDKLAAFKVFVHARLDRAGVPVDPPGKHRDEGCRVGQRLAWLIERTAEPAPASVGVREAVAKALQDPNETGNFLAYRRADRAIAAYERARPAQGLSAEARETIRKALSHYIPNDGEASEEFTREAEQDVARASAELERLR